jgi:uncharacterized membrane protein
MTEGIKRGHGLSIVGFVLAVLGFIFLGTDHAAIGVAILMVGFVLVAAGVATARKAPPPADKK